MFTIEKLIVPKTRTKSFKDIDRRAICLRKNRWRGKKQVDHEGHQFDTIEAMCDYWGVKPCTYAYRIKRGVSICFALTGQTSSPQCSRYDHEGHAFKSVRDMCDYWGVNYNTYKTRMRKGVSKKFALTGTV